MIQWDRGNLDRHFTKRINEDRDCMEDIFKKDVNQIRREDYEQASISAISTAWLTYNASEKDRTGSTAFEIRYYPKRSYFIDDRLLKTIVSPSKRIVTCFHMDFGRPHKKGQGTVEQMLKCLDDLINRKKIGDIKEISISKLDDSLSFRKTLKIESGIVSAVSTPKDDVK